MKSLHLQNVIATEMLQEQRVDRLVVELNKWLTF